MRLKSDTDISKLREVGFVAKDILDQLLLDAKQGVVLKDIDAKADELLKKNGATAWFREVQNYPNATCISVNDVWIHGIPDERILREGDIVSIDLGVKKDRYYIDTCWTVVADGDFVEIPAGYSRIRSKLGHENPQVTEFLQAGILSVENGISQFQIGGRTGDISYAMQEIIKNAGYSVIKNFTGHGVGFDTHEDPQIPCYGTKGAGKPLKKGLVLAIEVMYAMGESANKTADDNWTIVSSDGSLTAMFEHTVALTQDGPEILTK